jgi:hypothetical protein
MALPAGRSRKTRDDWEPLEIDRQQLAAPPATADVSTYSCRYTENRRFVVDGKAVKDDTFPPGMDFPR